MELIELIKEGIKWFLPLSSIETNPYIPIYIFSICVLIGFLIINYKYIIEEFNQTYENLNYTSKMFLSIAVGFIIALTATVMLLALNVASSVFFQYSIINNFAGMIILIFSLILGFIYFINLESQATPHPFYIIKKLYSIMLKLIWSIFTSVGVAIIMRAVYLEQTKSVIINLIKILAEFYLFYFLLKTFESIFNDYYKDYKKSIFLLSEIKTITSNIEKLYSFIEHHLFLFVKNLKSWIQ